eukprot:jgi/Botrbrau1/2539/Bobra.0079s0026.1
MAEDLLGSSMVMSGDGDLGAGNADEVANAQAELEAMKARLAQMESDAAKLRGDQGAEGAGAAGQEAVDQASREEADSRSIYVGNVDYVCTPEELQVHFQGCGTVNRGDHPHRQIRKSKGLCLSRVPGGRCPWPRSSAGQQRAPGPQYQGFTQAHKRARVSGAVLLSGGGAASHGAGAASMGRGFGARGYPGAYDYYAGGYGGRGRGRGRFYSPY